MNEAKAQRKRIKDRTVMAKYFFVSFVFLVKINPIKPYTESPAVTPMKIGNIISIIYLFFHLRRVS